MAALNARVRGKVRIEVGFEDDGVWIDLGLVPLNLTLVSEDLGSLFGEGRLEKAAHDMVRVPVVSGRAMALTVPEGVLAGLMARSVVQEVRSDEQA